MDKHVLLFLFILALSVPAAAGTKLSSLGISERQKDLFVDAHFEDRDRTRLTIEASAYKISVEVPKPKITALFVGGRNVLRSGSLEVGGRPGRFSSASSSKRARLNIWRHGPYYYEIHILDFHLSTADGKEFPGTGELVFYCYPEKFHIQAIIRPSEDVSVDSAVFEVAMADDVAGGPVSDNVGVNSRLFNQAAEAHTLGVVSPPNVLLGEKGAITGRIPSGSWHKGDEKSVWLAILPSMSGEPARVLKDRMEAEVSPLDAKQVVVLSGGAFEGYDRVRGHYVLRSMPALGGYGFESSWVSPNRYLTTSFTVKNDGLNRRIHVKHYSYSAGTLEAAVVTDRHGFPLPLPVQVCKNFGGEREEPDDTPFSESYFPLSLEPGQSLDLRAYHLYQNWGNHPLKQVSSIRFFEHYYHLSTGVTETTCYVPFTKFAYPSSGYTIADFRGMSGITWLGQPQHHHVALIGFLQYYDGEWHNLRYLNTKFEYISPCLAKFTMNYMSDDDKVRASVDVMEIPQLDETRSFVRIRYDVLQPVEISGDIRRNLRFVNANTDITRNRYAKVAYLDADNQVKEVDLRYDGSWALEGVPLGKEYPFICMYPSEKSNNAFIVLRYEGRISGEPLERLGTSAVGYENGVAEQFLTVPSTDSRLLPGDYFEAEVILMPYGSDWHDWRAPNRERTYYGSAGPSAAALHGTKLADFPAKIRIGRGGYAEFKIAGGHDYVPFIAAGFPHYSAPMLWEKAGRLWNFVDQQVKGNDWYQVVQGDEGFDFVFLTRQRNGMEHQYMVTQAYSDTGVASIRAENGEVVVSAAKVGQMQIVSPRLFDMLANHVRAGSSAVRSVGRARVVRTVPILASAKAGSVAVVVNRAGEEGWDIVLEGDGSIEFLVGHMSGSHPYLVHIGEHSRTLSADRGGSIRFDAEVHGKLRVTVRPAG